MRKLFVPALALLVLTYAMLAQAQRGGGPPTMPPAPGSLPAHQFEKVAEGVYYATATGSMTIGSNAVVIVNDEDVLLVDPGITAGGGHRVHRRRQDADEQADQIRRRHALSLRSRVRQSGVRPRRHDHRPRHDAAPPQRAGLAEGAHLPDEQHGGDRESLHAAEAADLGSEGSEGARDLRTAARDSSAVRRRAAEAQADAAQRDAVARHDAASRQPRNSDSLLRPRPHRRRHRRVSAEGAHGRDRRHDHERAVIYRRCVCRGVAGDARRR